VVRALCGEDTFTSGLFGDSEPQSRYQWGKAMSYLDAIMTAMIFWVCLWMAEKEKAAVHVNDQFCCSADDYTLRLLHIPPPQKGLSPDLDKLKRKLKAHFDDFAQKQPPVIFERPVKVLDINFGLNNQDTIRNMKIRGGIARVLDLEVEKLTLMNKYSIHSEEEIHKQDVKVRVLKVKFLQVCELVKYRKTRLEARTAFITFASEEGFERCRRAYAKSFLFGQPKNMMYGGGRFKMRLQEVMRPSDYIWEHLSTAPLVRFVKVSISNLLAVSILVVGFAAIIKAKGVESSALLALSSTDCSVFQFRYSGEPEWDSVFALNATAAETTRFDVVKNLFPTYYNNSYPNPGVLGCFCLDVSSTHSTEEAEEVEFADPYTGKKETLCQGFFEEYGDVQVMSTLAVMAVVVVNEILKTVFRVLVAFEGHETLTEEILAHTIKLFGSMLMNTAFIVVLIAGNVNLFTGGKKNAVTTGLADAALLSGGIADFSTTWYLEVGTAIVITMWINIYVLNVAVVQDSVKIKLLRCLDRGCSFDMARTNQKLQVHLETMYTGPDLLLEVRYSSLLVGFFVCMIFSSGMPILWIIGWASFLVAFCIDKWAFLRVYRLPPKYGATLARYATDMLPWAVLMHVVFASWTFSNPELFDFEGFTVEQGNSSQFVWGQTWAEDPDYEKPYHGSRTANRNENLANTHDFWPPPEVVTFANGGLEDTLNRALLHRNSYPHTFLLCVWIAWYVLFRLLDLDDILVCFLKMLNKDEKNLADVIKKGAEGSGDDDNGVSGGGGGGLIVDDDHDGNGGGGFPMGGSETSSATSSEATASSEIGRVYGNEQSPAKKGEENGVGGVEMRKMGDKGATTSTNGGAPSTTVSDDDDDENEGVGDEEEFLRETFRIMNTPSSFYLRKSKKSKYTNKRTGDAFSARVAELAGGGGFGAPGGTVDDQDVGAAAAAADSGGRPGSSAGARPPPRRKKSGSSAPAALSGGSSGGVAGSGGGSGGVGSAAAGTNLAGDNDDTHHHDFDSGGLAHQENLTVSDTARFTFSNMVGIGAGHGETPEEYEAKFQLFLSKWQNESGIAGMASFLPEEPSPDFEVAIESMNVDFRERWLKVRGAFLNCLCLYDDASASVFIIILVSLWLCYAVVVTCLFLLLSMVAMTTGL
jgi:hypothetical protein